jgi:hypothetical protein
MFGAREPCFVAFDLLALEVRDLRGAPADRATEDSRGPIPRRAPPYADHIEA